MTHEQPCVCIFEADGQTVIETMEPIVFADAAGQDWVIPVGFRSDGASVPRVLWRLLSPAIDPQTLWASLIHDYCYLYRITTRQMCDAAYRDQLIEDGYPAWKARLTYCGLRLFGGSHWGGANE